MILKNCWYVIAFADEVGDKPVARTVLNQPVVLFRSADGTVAALQDRCCHRGLPLAHGAVVPEGLQCGYHGLVFNPQGRCVRVPGQDVIPPTACVAPFPVAERDGMVWIWPGDAARANTAQIQRYPWHDTPGWAHRGKRNAVQSDYMLILDNLLDLTHVGYVHKSTIGGQPDAHSSAEMKIMRHDDGVSVVRWLRNSLPPPTYVQAAGFKGRVDRWIEIDYKPGLLTINAGAKDVDTGAYEGDREGGFFLRSAHAVTPETDRSAHYFWTIAHKVREDWPDLTQRVFEEIDAAFAEDKVIIESQFVRLQQQPMPALVSIRNDGPQIHAHRIHAQRLAQEQAPPAIAG